MLLVAQCQVDGDVTSWLWRRHQIRKGMPDASLVHVLGDMLVSSGNLSRALDRLSGLLTSVLPTWKGVSETVAVQRRYHQGVKGAYTWVVSVSAMVAQACVWWQLRWKKRMQHV